MQLSLWDSLWTALWWIFEAVPIPVASLLPLSLLPLFGILSPKVVGEKYGHPLVLLLLGGFLLSKAMEKSGAHRRIALMMVNACPSGEKFLILGFMTATAFLSMWISNTATTLMMLPMALAVIQGSQNKKLTILCYWELHLRQMWEDRHPIGTPPNLVMIGAYKDMGFPELSFSQWMKFGVPVTIIMVLVIWLWLSRGITGKNQIELPNPGKWQSAEVELLQFLLSRLLPGSPVPNLLADGRLGLIYPMPMMPVLPFWQWSLFSAYQWQFEEGSLTGLENSQSDSLGHAGFSRCRTVFRGRIQTVRIECQNCRCIYRN